MTTAKDIERALFALAPRHYAEEWDNVGLLCGRREKEVRKIEKLFKRGLLTDEERYTRVVDISS